MNFDAIRAYCLSFHHVTEDVQWENDLLFRVGGKIFAGMALDPASPVRLSFKCTPEKYAELIEQEGIIPAPYVARYHWVALQRLDALSTSETKKLLKDSYEMVRAKLPRKAQAQLDAKRHASPKRK